MEGEINSAKDRYALEAFNKYFGDGMASLVFQEIREFRSLAYDAYAYYGMPWQFKNTGYLLGYVGCQADKTLSVLEVMDSIYRKMPAKPQQFPTIKSSLIQGINSIYPSFRDLSKLVADWKEMGYTTDPRIELLKKYNDLSFEDILEFYKKNFSDKPISISIYGNLKRFNKSELKKYGRVVEVKKKKLFTK